MVQSANASVQRIVGDTRQDTATDVIDPEYFAGLNRNSTASTPQACSYRLEAFPSLRADSFGARHWISQAFPSLPCGPFPIDCKIERPDSETSVVSRSMMGALMPMGSAPRPLDLEGCKCYQLFSGAAPKLR